MNMEEHFEELRRRYGVSRELFEELKQDCSVRTMKKGDILLRAGEPIESWYILLSGGVKQVQYLDEGASVVNSLHFKPMTSIIPMEFNLYEEVRSKKDLIALKKGAVLVINCRAVVDLMGRSSEATECVVKTLNAYRLWYANFHFAKSRYHNNLKELLQYFIREDPYLIANAGLEDLSSYLGVSYYHLSRVKSELKREKPELFEELKQYAV